MKRTRPTGLSKRRAPTKRRRKYRVKRKYNNPYPGGMDPLDGIGKTTINRAQKKVIPQSVNVKLKYADSFPVSSSAPTLYNYRIGSLFDPDYTGVGHQPMGFDQWSAFYERYRVNAIKMRVTFVNGYDTSSPSQPLIGAIWPNYQRTTGALGLTRLMELPNVSYQFMAAETGGGSDTIRTIEFYTKINDFYGISPAEYRAEESYAGTDSTSPVKDGLLGVQSQGFVGINPAEYWMFVNITYYATFYQPKTLVQS